MPTCRYVIWESGGTAQDGTQAGNAQGSAVPSELGRVICWKNFQEDLFDPRRITRREVEGNSVHPEVHHRAAWLEEAGIQHPTRRGAQAGKAGNQCTIESAKHESEVFLMTGHLGYYDGVFLVFLISSPAV